MNNEKAMERFWSKVEKTDGCWIWKASTRHGGYGQFWDGKRKVAAHRFLFESSYGPVGDGIEICHKCDNPPCVRLDHLFAGTKTDNMRDAWSKGRLRIPVAPPPVIGPVKFCRRGHAKTADNVYRNASGRGWPCRTCSVELKRQKRAAR